MKLIELVKISSEALKLLSKSDGNLNDWRYVSLFEEFNNMRRAGIKYRAAISILSADYNISRATVERIIKRLSKEC